MFLSLPGSTTISTLVTASVLVPISVSLSVSGPAITVFVSLPFPLSFPLPFPLLLPLTVPPFSLPLSLFFPFLPFPLKLQPLFLPLVLFFFELLQSKTESGSANDTPDSGNPTITLSSAWIKWFPDLKWCFIEEHAPISAQLVREAGVLTRNPGKMNGSPSDGHMIHH